MPSVSGEFSVALPASGHKAVERFAYLDLAGEAGIGLGQRGKAQHAGLLRARHRCAGRRQPALVNIDVAGRTGAFAAAIGIDAGNIVVDRAAHYRASERHFDLVLAPAIFDVGDLRHESDCSPLSLRAKRMQSQAFASSTSRLLRRALSRQLKRAHTECEKLAKPHAAVTALCHCTVASARKRRSVDRETRWR